MAKRRAGFQKICDNSTDSNSSFTDSENEFGVTAAKRKTYLNNIITDSTVSTTNRIISGERLGVELGENEHSYSCASVLNVRSNKLGSNQSVENRKYTSRQSRITSSNGFSSIRNSTSSESSKSVGENVNVISDNDFKIGTSRLKRKAKCFTKNAVNARMNRLKKKQYITTLEGDVETLKDRNRKLLTELGSQNSLIDSLRNEIQYLRSVLANSKEIGMLLKRVCSSDSGEMKMSSSLINTTPENDYKGTVNDISSNLFNSLDSFDFSEITDTNLNSGTYITEDVPLFSNAKSDFCELPLLPSFGLPEFDDVFRCETPSKGFEVCEPLSTYGVCLHVANKQVSLEFCASCNQSASSSTWNAEKVTN